MLSIVGDGLILNAQAVLKVTAEQNAIFPGIGHPERHISIVGGQNNLFQGLIRVEMQQKSLLFLLEGKRAAHEQGARPGMTADPKVSVLIQSKTMNGSEGKMMGQDGLIELLSVSIVLL